jgi:hypothetical protein
MKYHHSTKWSVSRDDVHQKVKQQIGTQKFMLTVIWGIDGFHVVDLRTEQHNYNTQYRGSIISGASLFSHILEVMTHIIQTSDERLRQCVMI